MKETRLNGKIIEKELLLQFNLFHFNYIFGINDTFMKKGSEFQFQFILQKAN